MLNKGTIALTKKTVKTVHEVTQEYNNAKKIGCPYLLTEYGAKGQPNGKRGQPKRKPGQPNGAIIFLIYGEKRITLLFLL